MKLEVDFWNVGQGDASLVRWTDGSISIIDLGPPGSQLTAWLAAPEQSDVRIRNIVITHNDEDHLGDLLEIIRAHAKQIENVHLIRDRHGKSSKLKRVHKRLKRERDAGLLKYHQRELAHGEEKVIAADPNLRAELVLVAPSEDDLTEQMISKKKISANAMSAILCLRIGNEVEMIWGGDAPQMKISQLFENAEPCMLMGPHHGSPVDKKRTDYPKAFDWPNPEFVFVSVGYGHGHPNTTKFLKHHIARERGICCTNLIHCDRQKVEEARDKKRSHVIVREDEALGMRGPTDNRLISCRGAVRLTYDSGEWRMDDGHKKHRKFLNEGKVARPYCCG